MVSSKNVKVSQKRCPGASTEGFTGSSPSEQSIIEMVFVYTQKMWSLLIYSSKILLQIPSFMPCFLVYVKSVTGQFQLTFSEFKWELLIFDLVLVFYKSHWCH